MAETRVTLFVNTAIPLDGTTPIQGISLTANVDTVAYKSPTDPVQSGVYLVKAAAWERHTDWDTQAEVWPGKSVFVLKGDWAGYTFHVVDDANPVPGTDAIVLHTAYRPEEWEFATDDFVVEGGKVVGLKDRGIVTDPEDPHIDIPYPSNLRVTREGVIIPGTTAGTASSTPLDRGKVRLLLEADVALSGELIIDGVQSAVGDDVLVTGKGATNGVYEVASGAWARHADFDASSDFVPKMHFTVMEGTEHADQTWRFTNISQPTLGTDLLTFEDVAEAGEGLEKSGNVTSLEEVEGLEGTYSNPTIEVDRFRRIVGVSAGTVPANYIEGLELQWASGSSLRIKAGAAWVPGLNKILEVPADITRTGLTFAAGTRYFVFLYENAGVADAELVTTVPDVPYMAYAATKTGDGTRRYLGDVRSNSDGTPRMMNFRGYAGAQGLKQYQEYTSVAPFLVVDASALTGVQSGISCATVVPPGTKWAYARIYCGSGAGVGLSHAQASTNLGAHQGVDLVGAQREKNLWLPLASDRTFNYHNTASGGATTISILGYWEERG